MENSKGPRLAKNSDKEILETAKRRFSIGLEADSENREMALDDLKFRIGKQWDEEAKKNRSLEGRPCLTINKIHGKVHKVTNEQRRNRPSIRVSPVDDKADIKTAKIFQGLIKNIEKNSNADTAFDVGFESAVSGGRGFYRIITDYSDPMSFDQEARFKIIRDPNSVVPDPNYKEPDGSDMNWCFVYEDIPKDDFKALYPEADCSNDSFDWDNTNDWHTGETVRVTEYFERVFKKDKLIRLPDNSNILLSKLNELDENELIEYGLTRELIEEFSKSETRARDTLVPCVYWYKLTGNEVLEKTIFPSKWIPILVIHGVELIVDGKRVFEGIIRHAKDPQKMYNYWATCETESIALAPKVPWIGAEGQFEGHETKWENAHLKNYPYIEYKPVLLNDGTQAPPPSRNFGEPNVQAITQARMIANDDIKDTTSIFDASMGQRSNETSGKAILTRVRQSEITNYHFSDNLSRSIRHAGRILIDIIQRIYDSERVIRILNEDDSEEIVLINQLFKGEKGALEEHNFSIGKYDVAIDDGPDFTTRRQEAAEGMFNLASANPETWKIAGDLMVKSLDWPYAQEISERLKKMIPPDILGEDENTEIPPQVKAQLDQMGQMVEELTASLNKAQDELESKNTELESKERIEMAKIEKDLRIKEAELKAKHGASDDDLSVLAEEILEIQARQDQFLEALFQSQNQFQNNLNPTGDLNPGQTDNMEVEENLNGS
jgi:hypothetical protein